MSFKKNLKNYLWLIQGPDSLHVRAAGEPGEQVQDHPLPLRLREAQPGSQPQPNRDTGTASILA
jgi:hypothetical protein